MCIRMSEAEEEQARARASSAENAVNNESKKFNEQHHVRHGGRHEGNRKGFGQGRNGPKKECEGATKALDGHVFVDPVEDSSMRQDDCRKTIEAIETWRHTNQNSPQDIASMLKDVLVTPIAKKPQMPKKEEKEEQKMVLRSEGSDDDDEFELLLETWKHEVKDYVRRKSTLEHDLATSCKVACGQCTEQAKTKLKEHENYENIEKKMDVVG